MSLAPTAPTLTRQMSRLEDHQMARNREHLSGPNASPEQAPAAPKLPHLHPVQQSVGEAPLVSAARLQHLRTPSRSSH